MRRLIDCLRTWASSSVDDWLDTRVNVGVRAGNTMLGAMRAILATIAVLLVTFGQLLGVVVDASREGRVEAQCESGCCGEAQACACCCEGDDDAGEGGQHGRVRSACGAGRIGAFTSAMCPCPHSQVGAAHGVGASLTTTKARPIVRKRAHESRGPRVAGTLARAASFEGVGRDAWAGQSRKQAVGGVLAASCRRQT